MTIISAFNKPKITPQILDKKYLKKFKKHSNYESYINGEATLPNVSYCEDNDEVHYNPVPDPYNGHAYVDLGLPSGTKWATMNVGANSETDYGLYFQWGDTQGYADASTKAFSLDDYKWLVNGSTMSKYNLTDNKTVLDPEDDAATVNWSGGWHMPTKEQYEELFNTEYVTNAVITDYNGSNVNGCLFTSIINGNTMFVPAAGTYVFGNGQSVGTTGGVWSSSLDSSGVCNAWYFGFNLMGNIAGLGSDDGVCIVGLSIRGVIG